MDYSIKEILALISHIHTSSQDYSKKRLSNTKEGSFVSSHGFILFLLSKKSMTMGEISRAVNREKSTTTVLIRKLCNQGLVKMEENPQDKRSIILSLTPRGKKMNSLTSSISKELLDLCYKDFSDDEKEELLFLLKKMAKNLDQEKDR